VPEHDRVVATEPGVGVEEAVDGEGVARVVVELLVPEPQQPIEKQCCVHREVRPLVSPPL